MASGEDDRWYKTMPIVGEIDSWINNDSWQDRAFHKFKRCISLTLIGLDAAAFYLSKRWGIASAVVSNLIWQQDWDGLRVYFNEMSDADAKATYLWLHAWSPSA